MESKKSKEDRAKKIFKKLSATYPDATCELDFKTPLELLIATILAAQCTDVRVNQVTPKLFARYPDAKAFAYADKTDIEGIIRPTGFFRNKAKSIVNCCTTLIEKHDGKVPSEMEALTSLPGVGRKTANVIRVYCYGMHGIICDTHMIRLSGRLGFSTHKDATKLEMDLMELLPEDIWGRFSSVIVFHGRRCCHARSPNCPECPVEKLCTFKEKTI